MVGMIARSWARGQKDRRGRSSLSLLFVDLRLGLRPNFVLSSVPRPMLYVGLLELIVFRCRRNLFLTRCCFRRQIGS